MVLVVGRMTLPSNHLHDRQSVAPAVSRYSRGQDRELSVTIGGTAGLREQIHTMRRDHYSEVLSTIGVPLWDKYDDIATHFVCTSADGKALASLRSMVNTPAWGEIADDFPDLHQILAGGPAEFLNLGRELVIPGERRSSVSVVLVHAATSWWLRLGEDFAVLFTSLIPAVQGARSFGCRPLCDIRYLGQNGVPVALMAGSLRTVSDRSAEVLMKRGWTWTDEGWEDTGAGRGAGFSAMVAPCK